MSAEKTLEPQVTPEDPTAIDKAESSSTSSGAGYDVAATKRLVRKIDLKLLPVLSILYLLSFLDRTNIGNARLANLEKDLHMSGLDYNVALAVLFPFYVSAEIPSNIMMKRWRPSLWLPTTMVAWGIIATLMGLTTSYAGLVVARGALGLAEGGLFPGINFYISMWYRRHECGLRMAIFFSMATGAGAFGGLLARGISQMNGDGGKGGWAWIFILEGIITTVVAVWAYWAMKDYPDTAKFLTEDEKKEVHRRLEHDHGSATEAFHMKYVWQAASDWKVWAHSWNFFGVFTSVYSFSFFLPTIIKALGYTNNKAQLMTVPPYVVACFFCISTGYFTDRFQSRGVTLICYNLIAITGLIMLVASHNNHVKYAGTFFFAVGVYSNTPNCMAWNSNNVGPSTKRSIAIAMQAMVGNFGGILSAFIYLSKDSPRFVNGHCIVIGMLSLSTILSTMLTLYYRRENARRDREFKAPHLYTAEEKLAEDGKGDNASNFRYTV
ncbi:major facilitator superfamily transporter [Myriangium duriaei CBS 260.36]|uniref:Major facilitator superfamily transporter n=1 Tax=Myriangium duriaei CBS 260.36 TaxID=1168546 RepID=A0A9P4J4H7_9PEZI|nr:major facilitator superfamily transporter [Myriangium duriaei CBS 260.36]